MKLNKIKRIIAISILFLALLVLPTFYGIYYTTLYYVGIIILIPITISRIVWEEKFEKRFYERWHKARNQVFWINVVREGLFSLGLITVVVSVSQFIGNGRTPVEIVTKLSNSELFLILAFTLILSLIIGIVTQYENDKRYKRIYYSMENNKK